MMDTNERNNARRDVERSVMSSEHTRYEFMLGLWRQNLAHAAQNSNGGELLRIRSRKRHSYNDSNSNDGELLHVSINNMLQIL